MSKSKTIRIYEEIAGSLSEPSKMPGYGYGLPALVTCHTGSKLATVDGTTCSTCYACKGHYLFDNVKQAQQKRLHSLNNPSWVTAMVNMIKGKRVKYFRWHDSGDLLSQDHLKQIIRVAERLPEFKFWLPTQEHKLVNDFLANGGVLPDNLIVRLSTPLIDGRPVKTELCTSTVHKDKPAHGVICPAPFNGNKCGKCRMCWNKEIKNVSYRHH